LILATIILWHDHVECSQISDHGGAYQFWCNQITKHQSVRIIRQQLARGEGEFALSHLPNFGRVEFYGLRQLYGEGGDLIVWVYILRGVTKQRGIEMIVIHIFI
jgi:hypothetical protein